MLDEIKTSQVAGYILSKESNKTMDILKLMKLLYFVDRASLVKYGEPISYDNMVAMPHGMVLSNTYSLSTGSIKSQPDGWDSWISDRSNHKLSLKKEISSKNDFDSLSNADLEIIDDVLKEYGNKSGFELADLQHNTKICPEWKDPNGSSIPINYYDIFVALGKNKKEASMLTKRIEEQNAISEMF